MQILHWLSKGAQDQEKKNSAVNHPRKGEDTIERNAEGKEIKVQKRDGENKRTKGIPGSNLCCCNYLKLFAFRYKKDIPEACFYGILNLRKLGSSVHPTQMKKKESSKEVGNANKVDSSGAYAGNKVLPITEAPPLSSSAGKNGKCGVIETKDQTNKWDKKNPISKMKELLRWAASTKTEKGGKLNGKKVSMFGRRGTLKEAPDGDKVRNDTPKISFVESCTTKISFAKDGSTQIAHSTTTSVAPAKTSRLANRPENWITTDEYVVLEL